MHKTTFTILATLLSVAAARAAVDPITSFNNLDFDNSTSGTSGGFDTGGYDVPGWTDYDAPLADAGIGGVPGDWWSAQDGYAAFMASGDAAYTMSTYTIQSGDRFAIDFYAMHWEWEGTGEWTVTLFYDNPANVIGTFVQGGLPNSGTWTRYTSPAIAATPASVGHTLGVLFTSTGTGISQVDEITVGWPLDLQYYWGDDFSGTLVNEDKWQVNGPDWGMSTASPTAASASKVHVGDGSLSLEATRTKVNGSNNAGDEIFDGGLISTDGKPRFSGDCYIEARILLPDTIGSWPAFWALHNGWPPEMDIMEYPYGAYGNDQYHTAFHYTNPSGGQSAGAGAVNPGSAGDLRGSYHIFGVDWDYNNSVRFYFDGAEVSSFYSTTEVSEMADLYLILNYAVGGWPAVPSTTDWPVGFTDETLVDWVRVWKYGATKATAWQGDGAGSNAAWNNAGHWSNGEPTLSGVTANFDTISPETSQTVDIPGTRRASVINLDGSTRYRFGNDTDRLILGFGNLGAIQPAINMAATTTTEQEFWSILEWSGTLGINNDSSYPLLLTGGLVGGDGINIDGPGVVSFDGSGNNFIGTVKIGVGQGPGIVRARGQHALGHGDTVIIGDTGNATTARLELENDSLVSNPINLSGRSNASAGIVNNSGSNTISGTVRAQTGGANYWVQSDAGQLNLTGPVAMSSIATGTRTFTLRGAGDGMVDGAIENGSAGTMNIVKDGTGTWTLTDGIGSLYFEGANTYSGTTTVSDGTLVVNGTTGSGATTVASGATLAGRGLVHNNLVAQSGATIRIGEDGIPHLSNPTFALIDNFDSYNNSGTTTIGSSGSGDCTAGVWDGVFDGTGNARVLDVSGAGQVLDVYGIPANGATGWRGAKTDLANNFGADFTVPDSSVTTLFFRFRARSGGGNFDCMFGLTDQVYNLDNTDSWQDFAVMPFLAGGGVGAADFQVAETTIINNVAADTWYNVWLVVDTTANDFDVYTSTGTAAGTLKYAGSAFRNGLGKGSLTTFGVAQREAGHVQIDNIHISSGVDISNPLNVASPALTAETLSVENDCFLAASTALEFDLFDTSTYDRLAVGGNLSAGGTLRVAQDAAGTPPALGDTYDLFDATGFSGNFASYDLPSLAAGLKWNTDSIGNGVISVEADPSVFAGYMLNYGIPGALFEDDANSNGIPNGMEYYLGWNPTNPLTTNRVLSFTSNYLSVVHPYNSSASGVTGSVEWTTDLLSSNWFTTGITYATNSSPDEIEATLGSTTTNQLFIRLKVEQ